MLRGKLVVALLLAALPASADGDLEARVRGLFADGLPGMRLRELRVEEGRVLIGVELPKSVALYDLPPAVENRFESAVGMIEAAFPEVRAFELWVAYPGEALQIPPKPRIRIDEPRPPRRFVLPDPARFPDGRALEGKIVAISPGHGYIYYDSLMDYGTQRGRVFWANCGGCRGIVEDFETHEIVVEYLVPLLEGAGARVVLVRERDYGAQNTTVEETAAREVTGTFAAGPTAGASGGAARRSSSADAVAEWTITPPYAGRQLLSTWFTAAADQATSARLEVEGPFGKHVYLHDQRTHGRRWSPIGLFDLDPSTPITVRLSSAGDGAPIAFDAFRLGGGVHSTGHKWWEMGAEPFMDREAAPAAITGLGDVTARPAYAEWQDADLYLALHSNAAGTPEGTAVGTSSYRYSCGTFADHATAPTAAQCDDPPGSDRLQRLVHQRFIEHLRADWDPNWRDRGPKVANFGEVRGLDDMPGMLMESAFHDNTVLPTSGATLRSTENQALHDPRWRRAAAYGLYHGLSEFLVGPGPTLLAPPTSLVARRKDATSITVDFAGVPGATRYRVYTAQTSRAFDQGVLTATTSATIENLTEGVPVAVRVAALNAAGEGQPSAIVAARPSGRRAQLLLIDGFEREDAWVQSIDNRHDTLQVHARALAGSDHAFDSASEDAWRRGKVSLAGYDAVIVALGRESTEHAVLTAPLRAELAAFSAAGGAIFASGSEIGWALDSRGDANTRAFLDDVFGVSLASDAAMGTTLTPIASGWVAAINGIASLPLDDGSGGGIQAISSDAFTPAMGATPELSYGAGTDVAAVRKDRNFVLGVALDSIASAQLRGALLAGWAIRAVPVVPVDPRTDGGVVALPDAAVSSDDAASPGSDASATADDASAMIADDAAVITAPDASGLLLYATSDTPISGGCGCTTSSRSDVFTIVLLFALVFRAKAFDRSRAPSSSCARRPSRRR